MPKGHADEFRAKLQRHFDNFEEANALHITVKTRTQSPEVYHQPLLSLVTIRDIGQSILEHFSVFEKAYFWQGTLCDQRTPIICLFLVFNTVLFS